MEGKGRDPRDFLASVTHLGAVQFCENQALSLLYNTLTAVDAWKYPLHRVTGGRRRGKMRSLVSLSVADTDVLFLGEQVRSSLEDALAYDFSRLFPSSLDCFLGGSDLELWSFSVSTLKASYMSRVTAKETTPTLGRVVGTLGTGKLQVHRLRDAL